MAKAMLRAGADPVMTNDEGCIALTYAASEGSAEVMNMLLEKATKTASHVTFLGALPLYGEVCHGGGGAIAARRSFCPLTHAAVDGKKRLVRILPRGVKAVEGDAAIKSALEASVIERRARVLRMLLLAEGERRQAHWANCASSVGARIPHNAASCGTLGALSVLFSSLPGWTRRSSTATAGRRAKLSGLPWGTAALYPRRRPRPCDGCC